MDFFDRVKQEVRLRNTTIEGLLGKAFSGEITRDVYNGWKRRGLLPRVDDALKIAEALEVSVEYLVNGTTDAKSTRRIKIEHFLDSLTDDDLERAQIMLEAAFSERVKGRRGGLSEGSAM